MVLLNLSNLRKTWIIDVDGVIFAHNKYLGVKGMSEKPLPGVVKFMKKIDSKDYVIIITARHERYRSLTQKLLKKNRIRYNLLLMDMPKGERILINDKKPGGLKTAYAINLNRDSGTSKIKIKQSDIF